MAYLPSAWEFFFTGTVHIAGMYYNVLYKKSIRIRFFISTTAYLYTVWVHLIQLIIMLDNLNFFMDDLCLCFYRARFKNYQEQEDHDEDKDGDM